MGKDNIIKKNDYVTQYIQNGQKIVDDCRQKLRDLNIPVWENYNNEEKTDESYKDEPKKTTINNIANKYYTQFSNPANQAYTNFVKTENIFLTSDNSSDSDAFNNNSTILSAGRIVETMETIDDAGERHLSFLSETAPESGNISGSINGYYEHSSDATSSIFLGSVLNCWQNKNKDIYTKFNATLGVNSQPQEDHKKIVGTVAFDGRLDKKNFIYGAGVEYNSYSNNSQILDIHVAGKHKLTGIGADLTRRSTTTLNSETGEKATVSNMRLKLDIVSNKNDNQSGDNKFSFEYDSSALPPDVEEINNNAKNLISEYIKPDRKNGSDVDFEYTENKCGITYEYNYNLIDKKDTFLSITPVVGLHNYTDQTLSDNNESLEMTGGIITQFGKVTSDGQTFKGSVTAMTDRIVKHGSHPYDSNYLLANLQYSNSKAKLNAQIDAGALKSGNINLQYVNMYAEKQMKNSSIELSTGIAKFKVDNDSSNLFNIMATYKYSFPYKTKK